MPILDRYILSAFLRNLALVLLTLVTLYSLIEFLEKVDDFIEFRAEFKNYLTYPFFHLPVMLANSLPMAVLLATFATIGGFSRSKQLTAMLSGGVSFIRVSRPLFISSVILAVIMLFANLWLVPWSASESHYILRTEIKGKSTQAVSSKELYFRDGNQILSINQAFPAKGLLLGLVVVEFNDNFMPVKRIQAERAQYLEKGQWRLQNAVIWKFSPETKAVASFQQQAELLLDLKRQPSEAVRLWSRPEDLPIGKLIDFTEKLESEGYDAKPYQVEINVRFAKAAIPIIMVLVGIPFSLQRGRNTSFSLGIVISLVIFVIYFILYATFNVFGAIDVLPPLIAAWAANILMALIGTWFFLRINS